MAREDGEWRPGGGERGPPGRRPAAPPAGTAEARAPFERLLSLRNDVGLLSEEHDPVERRLLGNVPQAISHAGLVNTAFNLTPGQPTPAAERPAG